MYAESKRKKETHKAIALGMTATETFLLESTFCEGTRVKHQAVRH